MKKPEVLSPVGNWEMLVAAVRSGADAVYFGMGDFNARRGEKNFDRPTLVRAVEYCRVRGVNTYLTLNTLLSDEERDAALSTAAFAYEVGVDAAIVQDLGLARLLHEQLPDFPLHASTQMTVHSPSALLVLKELGIVQVVVSREMSRQELCEFCKCAKELDIKVEVFVHGALCMSMSGQCYFSAILGSRSGNRGLCAGTCRLPFSADGGEGYALSLKDLSLVEHLHELCALGVSSFKIEGRLKRPEYVAAATAVCRKILDSEPFEEWRLALQNVFSRNGFTDGYYTGRRGRAMFGVRDKEDVASSASVLSKIHELYRTERQSVALSGKFVLSSAGEASFTVSDGQYSVTVRESGGEAATDRALDRESALSKLCRTGNTPFYFSEIETEIAPDLFYPPSLLNAMRREALEQIAGQRASVCRHKVELTKTLPTPRLRVPNQLWVRFSSVEQMPKEFCADVVVLPLESAWETYCGKAELIVDTPRGIVSEEAVFSRLIEAKRFGISRALCANLADLPLIQKAGLEAVFDYSMNLFSSEAVQTAAMLGADSAILSFEAKGVQIDRLTASVPIGMLAYGHLPLMLTRNCPIKTQKDCKTCANSSALTDRLGVSFPVRCRGGYSEVYNSSPLWLADKLHEFCVDFFVLYFTTEDHKECARVIAAYAEKESAKGEFTRGLTVRGVL